MTDEPARAGRDPGLARVVADADVLAADLLVGGSARDAMDIVRRHSWLSLLAGERLVDDAQAIVESLADASLAADWRSRIDALVEHVEQPPGDHPALAAARAGDARHVLSFDPELRSAASGAAIRAHLETSVKPPAAFARLFDPAAIYPLAVGGDYPGPDRDPRL